MADPRPTSTASDTAPAARLKMKELERATGVGRETIRFYIREGLLPEPERPAKNVAWYDASFIDKIRLIKELQEKRYLPLHVIQRIVGDEGEPSLAEVEALLDLDGKVFPSAREPAVDASERLKSAVRRLGVPVRDVRKVARQGAIEIVTRDGEEWIEGASLEILELWSRMRAAGFTPEQGFDPEQMGLYVDAVEWLAHEELRLFSRAVAGRVAGDEAVHMAEAGIDLMNRIFALMRKRTLLRLISEGNVSAGASRTPRARVRRRGTEEPNEPRRGTDEPE